MFAENSGSPIAKIRIARSDGQVRVEVEDRGKGIPPEKLLEMASNGTPGVGIRGMRERLRQLGGSLAINSDGNGKGTVIVARLPIASTSSTAAAGRPGVCFTPGLLHRRTTNISAGR